MEQKKIAAITYSIIGAIIVLGLTILQGWWTEPEVHVFPYEFEFKDELAYLVLRFESSSGVFVTGEKIEVMAFLGYSSSSDSNDINLLYFPDALKPEEYAKLLPKENFGKIILDEDGSGGSIEIPKKKILHNLGTIPQTIEFDVIWTEDGPKDAVLIMNAESISMADEELKEQGMVVEKIITIQPSHVKLQMKSNNVSLGLVVIIIAIAILTAFLSIEKIWNFSQSNFSSLNRNDHKRKK